RLRELQLRPTHNSPSLHEACRELLNRNRRPLARLPVYAANGRRPTKPVSATRAGVKSEHPVGSTGQERFFSPSRRPLNGKKTGLRFQEPSRFGRSYGTIAIPSLRGRP